MVGWGAVAVVGAVCWTVLALARGENVSALWILFAALSSYAIAYRFYSRFIAYRVLGVDNTRATPAERLENGVDFDVTDRRVLFGHHFAAIAGAGPLVGPVLAAQMGYLPGTIWIIVGVIFAGAVQDMVVLFFSMRRDGKSLGQMVREEIGTVGGIAALIAVFSIMIIILAVLALVVVNALAASPWGVFSIGLTIPIALFMWFLPALPATRSRHGGHRDRCRSAGAGDPRRQLRSADGPGRRADSFPEQTGPGSGRLRFLGFDPARVDAADPA
jgi:Carbon starvation protein, predicted membrane protein